MEVSPLVGFWKDPSILKFIYLYIIFLQVFLALNFFATGCYQIPIGNNRYVAVSQPTVSRAINCVVEALNHPRVLNEWVKFPNNMQKIKKIRNEQNKLLYKT